MEHTKEFLIEKRKGYLSYEEGEQVRNQLIEIYQKEYVPKHTKTEYFDLIMEYKVGEIEKRHPQETNWADTVFSCFSVVSQHVRGFTKEHCLDLIFDAVERQKEHIKLWETLPTIEVLVEQDITIDSNADYQTKISNYYIRTFKGSEIIEMKKIGLSEWRLQEYIKLTPQWKKDIDRKFIFGE